MSDDIPNLEPTIDTMRLLMEAEGIVANVGVKVFDNGMAAVIAIIPDDQRMIPLIALLIADLQDTLTRLSHPNWSN